jgi:4-amino-4-deoxy-L-arabinose transferase-like glycosyltransferase
LTVPAVGQGGARATLPVVAVIILALVFGLLCARFVWQPTLATFADDSVSYLVMAQVLSPYATASQAVAAAFPREAFYPPLFPLVLALAGAAHNIAWAHALTAFLLAAAIPLVYVLGTHWLDDRRAAAAVAFCVVLLPSLWINAKGILSEPLFCLLLLATLCALEAGTRGKGGTWKLTALMAAMALTRTAALPVVAAYALWALTRRGTPLAARARAVVPALAAVAVYAAWVLLRPATTTDNYARIVTEHASAFFGAQSPLGAIGASLLRQANAVAEGWVGSLLVYWVEGRPLRLVLAGAVGCLAFAGMVQRLLAGKADSWMLAAYLATLLIWPFYDQMGRFLFPVLPVLVLYAFQASATALRSLGRPPGLAHGLLAVLMISLTAPALAFIYQRARAEPRFAEIVDWYRTPDLTAARRRVQVHLDLFADMAAIKALTRPEDRVMWVAPSYIALLADRRGIAAPDERLSPEAYRKAVRGSGADYVFLSVYHPRDTLSDLAWQAGFRALTGYAQTVHVGTSPGSTVVSSVLLKAVK